MKRKYWLRIITNDYKQPIDDIKNFIYHVVEDDISADVEFLDYIPYWKIENYGELLIKISTDISFDIIRNRIARQWIASDKIGHSFVVDSRLEQIYCKSIFWINIELDKETL